MTPTLRRLSWWGRQTLLTVGAVVGTVCIALGIAAAVFGLRPLVFESGSMSPTIDTGALAISRKVDASALKVGDIVSVPTGSGERVTHRIVTVTVRGDVATMALQGDANDVPDPRTYQVSHADRVLFAVPLLGYAVSWLVGPIGLFLLGLYAAFLLAVILRRGSTDDPPPPPAQDAGLARHRAVAAARVPEEKSGDERTILRGRVGFVAFVAATASLLPAPITPTLAAWSDATGVSGTALTAYTVPQPALTCAAGTPSSTTNTQHMTYTWPGSTNPDTTYNVVVSGLTTPTTTLTGTTTRSVDVSYDSSIKANKDAVATFTVSPALTNTPSWTGPQAVTKFRTNTASKAAGICGDADAPTNFVFAAPDATTRTVAAEKNFITSTCTTSTLILCGTYDDASTVATMDYTLKRTQGSTVRCWTGSWSNTAVGGVCSTYQAGSTGTSGSFKTFYASANQANVFPTSGGSGDFVLTVRITDNFDNVGTQTLNFTLTP